MTAEAQQATGRSEQRETFAATLSRSVFRRLMVSLAVSATTAATAYLAKKGQKLWAEKAAPEIEARGGFETVAKEGFSKAADWIGSTSTKVAESGPVSTVVEKVADVSGDESSTEEPEIQPVENVSDPEREAERRERRKRREARQRALKRSRAA